jgi:EH_Signature domain
MINFVNDLSERLEQVMASSRLATAAENWGNPAMMSRALARVERNFTAPNVMSESDRRSVAEAVIRFRNFRVLTDFRETKYVCIGASQEFSGWCLLQDHALLEILLQRASAGSNRRRLKYFTCLLSSYWSFPRDAKETSAALTTGWVKLREWLNAQRLYLDRSVTTKPFWFSTLNEHANLLTGQPCKRYGPELLRGVTASLNRALEDLGVGSDSWLRNEAIYAQMQAGVELADMQFQSCLPRLMDAASGKSEFRLSRSISIRCLALLVSRYAACASTPEHIPLRDATIAFIGNPWLHRAAWDAYVVDRAGRPDDRAREMVNGWLKVRLIKDFFGLLSEDRLVDERRLNYWLGFEPLIQEMWFALGADALSDRRKEYVEFRQRANGRLLALVGSTPTSNNAFLMHLGEHLVVEFGIAGNACFVYKYDQLPPRIKMRLSSANSGAVVDIAELKARRREARLLHNGSWEPNFDAALCPLLGFTSSASVDFSPARRNGAVKNGSYPGPKRTRSFSRLEFEGFRSRYGLDVEDLVAKGGCLWVRTDAANPEINERLESWGFAYRPARGWWKE